jgi:UDP-2,4-diacetamido-2,4,6-trideoxy-beta-L-altropyranose hydrolase
MNYVFRVDASSKIGSGHVIRCLTLAKELGSRTNNCQFICRNHDNNLIKKIKKENFSVFVLKNLKKKLNKKKMYSDWLGVDWNEDANQTINILKNHTVDWLIVDHYSIDHQWEKKVRPYVKNIMVLDDLANRKHDCDILLDQNLIANYKDRYKNLLKEDCVTLLGPKFSLLQNQYKELHKKAKLRAGIIKNILVYFGATDQNYLIEMTLSAIVRLNNKQIKTNVFINSNNYNKKTIKNLKNKFTKNIKFYVDKNSLAMNIFKADIAIGACGTTAWERCCLGLPSLVITVSENQKPIAKELHKRGLIYWLGHYDKITKNLLYKILRDFINNEFTNYFKDFKSITDGSGAEKVSAVLTLSSNTVLKFRPANLKDKKLLLDWANDPSVRLNSSDTKIISAKTHEEWFDFCLKNPERYKILIFETKQSLPIGQVCIEKKNKKWFINYSLATYARKKKIGYKILNLAMKKFKTEGIDKLYGKVKI